MPRSRVPENSGRKNSLLRGRNTRMRVRRLQKHHLLSLQCKIVMFQTLAKTLAPPQVLRVWAFDL